MLMQERKINLESRFRRTFKEREGDSIQIPCPQQFKLGLWSSAEEAKTGPSSQQALSL